MRSIHGLRFLLVLSCRLGLLYTRSASRCQTPLQLSVGSARLTIAPALAATVLLNLFFVQRRELQELK